MDNEHETHPPEEERPLRTRRRRPAPPKKSRWIMWVSIGCFLSLGCLGLLGIAGYWGFRAFTQDMPAAQVVAEQFLDSLKENKVEDAYALTTSDFRAKQDAQQFAAFVNKFEMLTHHTSRSRNRIRLFQGGGRKQVFIQMTLSAANNATTCTLVMLEENGRWKVDKITVP